MTVKLGTAKYTSGKKTFKVKKDEPLTARIIPPLGNLADKGKWNIYYAVEWGYKDASGTNKPFLDVHQVNRKTKMVEVQSPAHTRRDALKKNKDEIVAAFKDGNATKEEVLAATDLVKRYNLDKKFYLNVKLQNGDLGLLKINYKLKQALDAVIKDLRTRGVDPLSAENGRFFTFSSTNATGALQDWAFTVNEFKESIKTEEYGVVQKDVIDVLTPDVINRLGDECYELDSLYKTVTPEQVQRFVTEGAVAVEEILGNKNNAPIAPKSEPIAPTAIPTTTVAADATLVAESTLIPEATITPEPTITPDATLIPEENVTPVTETSPAALAGSGADQTDIEYLKSIGAM